MIEFKDVSFQYSNKQIFQDVNLNIESGNFIWLQGPNGTGKTTFLRLILDFIRPQAGEIITGKNLKVGWAPAVDNGFFLRLTGKENLAFFAGLANVKLSFPDAIDRGTIDAVLSTPFYEMSAGMKQLLILFRSLLINPDLLLFDEPIRGLDQRNRDLFFGILKDLNSKNKTIIMTSHQPVNEQFNNFRPCRIHDHKIL